MLVVGAIGLLLALAVGALSVVSAVVASHRAQSAADFAALAAASALVRGQPPGTACATATDLARRNGGAVVDCRAGTDLSVDLVVRVAASVPHVGVATARARAGPIPVTDG